MEGLIVYGNDCKDPDIREQMKKAMNTNAQDWENTYYGAGGAKEFCCWRSNRDSLRKYIGKTLEEVAQIRGSITGRNCHEFNC